MAQKLIALNTMYKKASQNQATYRTPTGVEKQLDYILEDRKHYRWCRDAQANHMIHMGNDHSSVMTRCEIPVKTKRKPIHSEVTSRRVDERTRHESQVQNAMKSAAAHGSEKRYHDLEKRSDSVDDTAAVNEESTKKAAVAGDASKNTTAAVADVKRRIEEKEEEILVLIRERRSFKKEE